VGREFNELRRKWLNGFTVKLLLGYYSLKPNQQLNNATINQASDSILYK